MAYEIGDDLVLIFQQIKQRTVENYFNNQKWEFIQLLQTLDNDGRYLIRKMFCKLPWNIGSLSVLGVLQELGILSATEFILSLPQTADIQLILNDFLEAEFHLFENLTISVILDSLSSFHLKLLMDECLTNFFKDLISQPHLNNLQCLQYLRDNLPGEIVLKILRYHLTLILDLDSSNNRKAFLHFSTWINEGVNKLDFLRNFYDKLLSKHTEEVLKYLLKESIQDEFKGWKFYLILLQIIVAKGKEFISSHLSKYWRTRLKDCSNEMDEKIMLHLLLTARAATASTNDLQQNLNNYANWYKSYISEMKFVVTTEEFKNILTLLEKCIPYEMEKAYLDIHATLAISPALLCGKLVQQYKSKCKQRLLQIKNGQLE